GSLVPLSTLIFRHDLKRAGHRAVRVEDPRGTVEASEHAAVVGGNLPEVREQLERDWDACLWIVMYLQPLAPGLLVCSISNFILKEKGDNRIRVGVEAGASPDHQHVRGAMAALMSHAVKLRDCTRVAEDHRADVLCVREREAARRDDFGPHT